MFVVMSKTFWAFRVSFLQIKKSQAKKTAPAPLFHTTGIISKNAVVSSIFSFNERGYLAIRM